MLSASLGLGVAFVQDEVAFSDAVGDFAGTEAVIEPGARDDLDQVDRHHRGDQLDVDLVGPSASQPIGRHEVPGLSCSAGFDILLVFSGADRAAEHSERSSCGSDERQWIDRERNREHLLAFSTSQVAGDELGLQREQLSVERQFAVVDVERVRVSDVVVGVEVTGAKHNMSVAVADGDLQEHQPFGIEAGWDTVTVGAVCDLDLERQAALTDVKAFDIAELVTGTENLVSSPVGLSQ